MSISSRGTKLSMSMVWLLSIWTASSSSGSISTYLPLRELIAAGLLVALDDVAGLGVDHLLLQPVAGLLVDQVEAGLSADVDRRIERDRAGHQRKFQGAFPIGAGGHYNLRTVEG